MQRAVASAWSVKLDPRSSSLTLRSCECRQYITCLLTVIIDLCFIYLGNDITLIIDA